ncbi:DUF6056 family protein [Clostridium butyricum]|uniref:DUF6056 family protein n=1 Tax=Clostridium butyricum TaxID=1492 RepID=UPI0034657A52
MKKLETIYKNKYFPFIILFIVMLILHMNMTKFIDDMALTEKLQQMSLKKYLINGYYTWSSRQIINFILGTLLMHNLIFWKIIDSSIIVLLAYSLSNLIDYEDENKKNWIISLFILIYPFAYMASAGWMATTVNYLWPLSLGIFSLIPIRKIINNNRIAWYEAILYILATIFVTNLEQAVMFIPIYSFYLIYFWIKKNRKYNWILLLQVILSAINLIYKLTCPGSQVRTESEIITWFPDYNMLSFIDKIKLGLTSTAGQYITTTNTIFLIITFSIMYIIWKKYEDTLYRWISAIPFAIGVIMGLLNDKIIEMFPFMENIFKKQIQGINDFIEINAYNFEYIQYYFTIIVSIIVFGLIVLCIYLIFENSFKTINYIGAFLLAFASRMIMSFSPTIYASSLRTYIFLDFIFIILGIVIYLEIDKLLTSKKKNEFFYALSLISIVNVLSTFVQVR